MFDQSSIFDHICSALGARILAPQFQAVPCDMLRWPPVPVFQDALKWSEGEAGRVTCEITEIVGGFVCDHPAFGDIEFGHSIFSRKRSPQESEEGNESYSDRSLRFNILYVMWLVSNCMFFTAEINGDSLRSLAEKIAVWLMKKGLFLTNSAPTLCTT